MSLDTYLNTYVNMKNIIPVSDLLRQSSQILSDLNAGSEPIVITQRGRASAVLVSAKRYAQIEEILEAFDDMEMERLIAEGEKAIASGDTLSHEEVKRRLNFPG
ncbi:MAG: type II toxin-antitoxin system Phd/YefM family antitoxin [Pyrinomonadaceae bacterium]